MTCHTFAGKEPFSVTTQTVKSSFIPNEFSAEKGTKSIKTHVPSFKQQNKNGGLNVTQLQIKMKGKGCFFFFHYLHCWSRCLFK